MERRKKYILKIRPQERYLKKVVPVFVNLCRLKTNVGYFVIIILCPQSSSEKKEEIGVFSRENRDTRRLFHMCYPLSRVWAYIEIMYGIMHRLELCGGLCTDWNCV